MSDFNPVPAPDEIPPLSGPAPHSATQTGFLENPLMWLAETTGIDLASPADEAILAGQARRWTSRIIIVATLMLAVFNSATIQTWATTLAPDWSSQTVDDLADVWTGRLAQLGLDRPRAVLHDDYEAIKQLQWRDMLHALRLRDRDAAKPAAPAPKPNP